MNRERPDLASLIEHAQLDPHQGRQAVERCCDEARHFGFAGVCVASRWVDVARQRIPRHGRGGGDGPQLVSVIGFPFGAMPAAVKRLEAEAAVEAGADELDVVPDFGALTDGDSSAVLADLAPICELGAAVKVIVEVGRLDPEALALLVEISLDAGARYLKSGTGFGPGATVEQISRLQQLVGGRAGIKASGGINTLERAMELVDAGAIRLGTSRGVALVEAMKS